MVAARAGSAMAAELGSMQATEQIDALTRDGDKPGRSTSVIAARAGRDYQLSAAHGDVRRDRYLGGWVGRSRPDGCARVGPFFNGSRNMSGHDIADRVPRKRWSSAWS